MHYEENSILYQAKQVLNTIEEDSRFIIRHGLLMDTYTEQTYSAHKPEELVSLLYLLVPRIYEQMKRGGLDG